ncbi:MAG: hypothetical protein KC944_11425 [Candidatus Omnitrophica bacterium]|nr:hypothetical protein [Candidatus Omnitrophota bacterium]MCA9425580.1 hypothetical protein [Candidatus Omnitrophota bacterium]
MNCSIQKFLASILFTVAAMGVTGFQSAYGQEGCEDYKGCEPVILKARGEVQDLQGNPIIGATVIGTENRRRDVNAIEFFEHCDEGFHLAREIASSTSTSGGPSNDGSFELLFIVCAQDRNDFAADFDVCVQAPGFQSACFIAEFDGGADRRNIQFNLVPSKDFDETSPLDSAKGAANVVCGDYKDCEMKILKVRGVVQDASGSPLTSALVTGVVNQSNHINAIQFYQHCNDGNHSVHTLQESVSDSGSSQEPGSFELLFSVCVEDSNDILPDDFDVDLDICATAPGYEMECLPSNLNEDDDRDDRTFRLVPVSGGPTETPTPTVSPTPTGTGLPVADNPKADVVEDGIINHKDVLEVLRNWDRTVP